MMYASEHQGKQRSPSDTQDNVPTDLLSVDEASVEETHDSGFGGGSRLVAPFKLPIEEQTEPRFLG